MIVATFYEPRRRWWGGLRADIVIERWTIRSENPSIFIVSKFGKTRWKAPSDFRFRRVDISENNDAALHRALGTIDYAKAPRA